MSVTRFPAMIIGALLGTGLLAQPGAPELSFTLVRDAKGRPMQGPYAENAMMREALCKPRKEPWTVEIHFTIAKNYPYAPEQAGKHEQWVLAATPMKDGRTERLRFGILDCWCDGLFVLVIQGQQSMRIDLPDPSAERWALVEHVMKRSGDFASPEVIRFRPGRFTYSELMNDPAFEELEMRLAGKLKAERAAAYQQQLAAQEDHYHNLSPPPPPAPPARVPLSPEQQAAAIELEIAQRPGLRSVNIARVNADTVWVSITGRVMLDGGCASGMPLFGVEMRTDTGWVERIPFELSQMDYGMPWADWDGHDVMIPPLKWWVGANSPADRRELTSGTYRLRFVGADLKELRTASFLLGP